MNGSTMEKNNKSSIIFTTSSVQDSVLVSERNLVYKMSSFTSNFYLSFEFTQFNK